MTKYPTSFRLSEPALGLIKAVAEELALSQAAVVEIAVRKLAKDQGVPVPDFKVSRP